MKKVWSPYARHILDTVAKIRRIEARGDLRQDDVLYDATLRNHKPFLKQLNISLMN